MANEKEKEVSQKEVDLKEKSEDTAEKKGRWRKKRSGELWFMFYYERISHDIKSFVKWTALAILTGLVVGGASGIFAGCISAATKYRNSHLKIFLLLPLDRKSVV